MAMRRGVIRLALVGWVLSFCAAPAAAQSEDDAEEEQEQDDDDDMGVVADGRADEGEVAARRAQAVQQGSHIHRGRPGQLVVGQDAAPQDEEAGAPARPEVDVLDQDARDGLRVGGGVSERLKKKTAPLRPRSRLRAAQVFVPPLFAACSSPAAACPRPA